MRPSHVVCALALALAAGSVQAQSFIPGNQVDDFGPVHYSDAAPAPKKDPVIASRASPMPANQIDDFGPLVSERKVAEEELGAAGGEPGMDARAAERAQEKAAIEAYNRERFVHEAWRATP